MPKFEPTEMARAALKDLHGDLADVAIKKFFELWEADVGDIEAPRKAGSVIAHAYMGVAARFAIVGCECSDKEPLLENWLAFATEEFELAIKARDEAREGSAVPGKIGAPHD